MHIAIVEDNMVLELSLTSVKINGNCALVNDVHPLKGEGTFTP